MASNVIDPRFNHHWPPWAPVFLPILLFLGTALVPCHADEIQVSLANGLKANADYRPAAVEGPAVLILHGFLATSQFPTVQHIAEELNDAGYTVLAPTLTLGVSNRTTSLPCNALHLHDMEQTIDELAWWVDWLVAKGHDQIHLIGHSSGSLQLLIYSLDNPHPAIRQLVLTSLVSLERLPGVEPQGESREMAQQRLSRGDHSIAKYDVSFCHGNFAAPPEVFLSYNHWTKPRIVEALQATRIPTTVIMGGNDTRFTGTSWMPMLRHATPQLITLDGASHFFDGESEFDLLDSVLAAIQDSSSPTTADQ